MFGRSGVKGVVCLTAVLLSGVVMAGTLFDGRMTDWQSVAGGQVRRLVPDPAAYAKGGELVVDVTVGWQDVVQSRPTYPWSGVIYTATATDPQGRRVHVNVSNLGWGTQGTDTWRFKGVVPEGSKDLSIELGVKAATGKISFGAAKVGIEPCDPAKRIKDFRFSEHQKMPVDLDFVDWYEREEGTGKRDQGLGNGGAEFSFFRVVEPGQTFDRYAPPEGTFAETFRLRMTPGEVRDLFFGVYAAREIRALRASVGSFVTPGFLGFGKRQLGGTAILNRVRNWRQCGDMGQRRSYTVLPEVIFPWAAEGESLPAGTTAQATLQLSVPADAEPGIYRSDVAFVSGTGERRTAAVELEVLPFKLVRPKPADYELVAHIGQYGETAERLEALAKELKRRGFESMLIATHYGTGRMKFRRGADGKVAIESFDRLRFAVRAYRAAGMTGTFFVHLSDKLEVEVARALGIKVADAHGEQTNMIPEFRTPDFRRHVGEALAAIRSECGNLPLAVLAMDEPNTTNRVPRAAYEIANIRAAGIPAALYGDQLAYWNVKPDYLITTEFPSTTQYPKIAADLATRPGTRLYMYEGSGSYHYSYGSMYVGRFNHGWGDYLAPGPCHGHTAWNFLANAPTDFDGLGHFAAWVSLDHFDRDMNLRWTLQFEAICEGFLDRSYVNTLETVLREKAGTPAARRVAADFAALKAECARRGSYRDPIRLTMKPAPKDRPLFLNADMDDVRGRVADLILELKK